ncbi:MAG: hypothetical protein HQL53_04460 [Magnetococcales bacterium]|nr:hypothetical protein [Magnetococcales bacterium]
MFSKKQKESSGNHKHARVDCLRCKHLVITWNSAYPRACRVMGFKSKQMPSQEVMAASGQPCLMFEAKVHKPETATPVQGSRDPSGRRNWYV